MPPMPRTPPTTEPLALPAALASLVRFVEETPPAQIVPEALGRLRAGTPHRELLAAVAVAVSRRTEIPFDHHGGPLHCVSGIRATAGAVGRLAGEQAHLPVLHSLQLANGEVNSDAMGPHIMLELGPGGLDGQAATAAFVLAIQSQMPLPAERHLRAVLRDQGPAGTLELILSAALPRQALDDHFLLYPVFAAQTLDLIGWENAEFILRPVVRWLASPPLLIGYDTANQSFLDKLEVYHRFGELDDLIDRHRLVELAPGITTGPHEDLAVTDLGTRIGATDDFDHIPLMMAEAIAGGLSLLGTLAGLSIGVATLHTRSDYGNPLDVHMHNGLSARRYLLALPGLGLRTRLTALLSWAFGPEIRLTQGMLHDEIESDASEHAVPGHADGLLDELTQTIEQRPPVGKEVHSGTGRGSMRADPGVLRAMALGSAYVARGYDPVRLAQRITELVCRDSFTEMHAFEHTDDSIREFATVRPSLGGKHLVSATKIAYCGYGIDQSLYQSVRDELF